MLGGSSLKASMSASLLILRRKAMLPSVPKPTTWKTSLPMSMPIEARCLNHRGRADMLCPSAIGCFGPVGDVGAADLTPLSDQALQI
jgi:hypothetical protein